MCLECQGEGRADGVVTHPITVFVSPCRYVRYYHLALTQHGGSVPQVGIRLTRVHISGLPVPLARDCTVSIWLRPPGSPHTLLLLHAHTSGLAVQSVQHEQVGKPCSQAISVQDACSSRPSLLGSVNATCSLWKGTHNTTASALCTAPNTKGLNTGKHGMSKSAALDVVLHGWRSSQEFPVTHGSAPACSRVWLGNLCMGGLAEPNVHAERPAVQGATGVHALEASASARVHVAEHSGMTGSQSRGRSVRAAANTLSASSTDKPAGAERIAGAPWASGTAKGLCKSDSGVELAGCLKVQVFKGRYSDEHSGVFKGGSTQLGAWMHTAFMRPGQRSHLTCRHGGTIDTRRSDASTGLHGSCVSPGVRGGGKQGLQADAYVTKQEGKGEAGSEEESARGASCCMVLEQDELDKVCISMHGQQD